MAPDPPPPPTPAAPPVRRCSSCFGERLEPGFLEDNGDNSRGHIRWIPGPLEKGVFGGARRMGKPRHDIDALHCTDCGHLDFFIR